MLVKNHYFVTMEVINNLSDITILLKVILSQMEMTLHFFMLLDAYILWRKIYVVLCWRSDFKIITSISF